MFGWKPTAVVGTESLQLPNVRCHMDRQNVANHCPPGPENPFVSPDSFFRVEGMWRELTLPVVRAMLPFGGQGTNGA